MNVSELDYLADWMEARFPELNRLYNAVLSPLQHNSSQPNKQPLSDQLEELLRHLRSMTFEELSLEQLQVLEDRDIAQFLGVRGADFVESTIKVSDFDPASAASTLQDAVSRIERTNGVLQSYASALRDLDIDLGLFDENVDDITIRVGFRRDASIDNITGLKRSAADWYDIMRGLSLAVNEPPENTRVVGAGTGSIILYLVATAGVTFLLARITKHITSIAKEIIEVENAREDLRQKKFINDVIEEQLNEQIASKQTSAVEAVIAEVKNIQPDINGEVANALEKSVKKLLTFSRKGGDVDFVSPATEEDEESEGENDVSGTLMADVRAAIQEYNSVRDEIKLLTDQSANDNSDG